MNRRARQLERNAGITLILVLFAVAMSTVLSLTFLSAQSTTTGIAQTARDHGHARLIAEAGMKTVIEHIKANDDWRTDFANGTWISNQSLAGGTFTVVGEDGEIDADGLVDGDGDLADDDEEPLTLTVTGYFDGASHVVRAVVHVEATTTGGSASPHGMNLSNSVVLTGSARIDAVNSSTTTYNPGSNSSTKGSVATNTTASSQVTLSGSSYIIGDVWVGVGGSTSTVISHPSYYTPITGTKAVLTAPISIPAITTPPGLPSTAGTLSLGGSGTTTRTAGNYRYNNVTVGGSHTLTISGAVVMYCDGTFTVSGSGQVRFNAGATLEVYASKFEVTGSGVMNTNLSPPLPSRLKMYQTGSSDLNISGSGRVYGCILAPTAKLVLPGSGRLFGSFHGKSAEITGSGRFTQDLALQSGGGIGGGAGTTTYTYTTTWSEQP